MKRAELKQLTERLLSIPTAPYHEFLVHQAVRAVCVSNGLECNEDEFGNLFVRLRTNPRLRPMVLAAHMDHPGFEILKRGGSKSWIARFLGGVPDSHFRKGLQVRLHPGNRLARVGQRLNDQKSFLVIEDRHNDADPEFAVWDIEGFEARGNLVYSRACDDLIGVVSVLATLIDLRRSGSFVHVIGVLTRAEEVGFHGALAV